MFATIVAAILGGMLVFLSHGHNVEMDNHLVTWFVLIFSGILLLSFALVRMMILAPLQRAEQNLTPRLFNLFLHDSLIKFQGLALGLFPLFSIAILIEINYYHFVNTFISFAIWLVLFGIAIDILYLLITRVTSYLNPIYVVDHFAAEAEHAIRIEDDVELCHWIDALAEVSIKAIDQTLPSLSIQTVENLQDVAQEYLESAKSLAHHITEENKNDKYNHQDRVSYILFYLFQRLELINEKALAYDLEPVNSTLITELGKIAVNAAKFDLSMATYPLHYLGKFARRGQECKLDIIAEKATCTFVEVAKIIVEEVDLKYLDLKEPFFSLIQHLEDIAKEMFRQDKTIKIAILIQPFAELKELFQSEKMATHRDSPTVIVDIERVINQFEQLELVMRTIPPINITEEEATKQE